nr:MAG: nonstructural protein [Microvirus sp.]
MIIKMFSVHDAKANAFLQPFFSQTAGTAERSFAAEIKSTDSQFAKFAEDFTLFEIGSFDDATGKMEPLNTPHAVVKAIQLLNQQ